MARYTVNDEAVAHVRELIDKRQYVLRSEWGEVQPDADAQNGYLERHDWAAYGRWHLGLTEGANDETKARYAFVVGGQRTVDHDEVVRLRRAHPDESLERLARRLGCSLSTVKRHLRRERNQPTSATAGGRHHPTEAQVRRATAETLAENSGNRRAAA